MKQGLRLQAVCADDLTAISLCLQDAAIKISDFAYLPSSRRFAFVGNRYMWEKAKQEEKGLRVKSACRFESVLNVQSQNFPKDIKKHVLSLLSIEAKMAESENAIISIYFSGDISIKLEVECIEAFLEDLSPPWKAKNQPCHGDDCPEFEVADESFEE